MTKRILLTGIKPTGLPHIGNYFGVIQPAISQASEYHSFFFIADYHALTTVHDAKHFYRLNLEVAAAWLACGLDPENVVFYRQSDIPEILELYWILSCFSPKGLLNRAHAYKSLVENNLKNNRDEDHHISMGIFNYPVLMAADILLFNTHLVPVGFDQKQHVEIARDIADRFNKVYPDTFVLPEPLIDESVQTIPGIDGQKMSKNYNNTIPLFLSEKDLKKCVMKIQTDSTPLEEPKNPETCCLFSLYQLFASDDHSSRVRKGYQEGGLGYGTVKQALFELISKRFEPLQKNYDHLINNPDKVQSILEKGKVKARKIAQQQLAHIKHKIGLI